MKKVPHKSRVPVTNSSRRARMNKAKAKAKAGLFKTELCRNFCDEGICFYGTRCRVCDENEASNIEEALCIRDAIASSFPADQSYTHPSSQFAHGVGQLVPKPLPFNFKTKLCRGYHEQGHCKYGSRCLFIHDEVENSIFRASVQKLVPERHQNVGTICENVRISGGSSRSFQSDPYAHARIEFRRHHG